jgi:2-haloalkanoic acid dehalogenase type II
MTRPIKAVLFDFMGTCLDWHSIIVSSLPESIPAATRSNFALQWRQAYFDANAARQASNLPPEDIDITHRRVLESMLGMPEYAPVATHFTTSVQDTAIQAWHQQRAWADVLPALQQLKDTGYELFVFANGTTRLQLNLCRSAGLTDVFSMLFSSELLGVYKPAAASYTKVMDLLKLDAGRCVMVAAHAYDLRGAKEAGIKTVYIRRWTDDILENQRQVEVEFDMYLEDMKALPKTIEGLY